MDLYCFNLLIEEVEDPCSTNPCEHGSCTPVGDGFQCHCHSGWTGHLCDSSNSFILFNHMLGLK